MLSKEEWRRRKRRKQYIRLGIFAAGCLAVLILAILGIRGLVSHLLTWNGSGVLRKAGDVSVEKMLLTVNEYSRPQTELKEIKGIVLHYAGEAGSTAVAQRNYYENLRLKQETYASVHFIVGIDGEIIQCIPLTELAYATKDRNSDTISIEFCHADTSGEPSEKTYKALVQLAAFLCEEYELKTADVLRHYDATGLECPSYYVKQPAAWTKFLQDVEAAQKEL